jgi:hypothetical protein
LCSTEREGCTCPIQDMHVSSCRLGPDLTLEIGRVERQRFAILISCRARCGKRTMLTSCKGTVGFGKSAQGAIYDCAVGGKAQSFGMATCSPRASHATMTFAVDLQSLKATCSGSRSLTTKGPLIAATYAAQCYQPPSPPFLESSMPPITSVPWRRVLQD